MSSFTPHYDDAETPHPQTATRQAKITALRAITNMKAALKPAATKLQTSNAPRAALSSIMKARANSKKAIQKAKKSFTGIKTNVSTPRSTTYKPSDPLSPLSSDGESDSDAENDQTALSDDDASVSSHLSTSSTASSRIRLALGEIQSKEHREAAAKDLRDKSDFKTPREPLQQMNGFNGDSRFVSRRTNRAPAFQPATIPAPTHPASLSVDDTETVFSRVRHNRFDQVEAALKTFPIETRDSFGNTLITTAAQQNGRKMVKLLLRFHANINSQNGKGNTALHYACFFEYKELAVTLKKYGAKDNIKNADGDICYTFKN